jgi:hypothetical protein
VGTTGIEEDEEKEEEEEQEEKKNSTEGKLHQSSRVHV